ncbi:MAG: hypothetical protein H7A51_13445 [Akkermansiaceae bacterium]|nr:hypothetical protein [Akkermansiaceae bacterium]
MNTIRSFIYLMGIMGVLVFSYFSLLLFGGYAQKGIDMLLRTLDSQGADDSFKRYVVSYATKIESQLTLLTWSLVILAAFTVIAIGMNWFLSYRLSEAHDEIERLKIASSENLTEQVAASDR